MGRSARQDSWDLMSRSPESEKVDMVNLLNGNTRPQLSVTVSLDGPSFCIIFHSNTYTAKCAKTTMVVFKIKLAFPNSLHDFIVDCDTLPFQPYIAFDCHNPSYL